MRLQGFSQELGFGFSVLGIRFWDFLGGASWLQGLELRGLGLSGCGVCSIHRGKLGECNVFAKVFMLFIQVARFQESCIF